ncbi:MULTISPECIES: GntR family transcriptional regulator [Inquilinus]|uniref:DNA-binding GntR family transcriptional regulator n=1 Tax=Inquilinus ginsengisoli TaxID=363840 RepID=A0ABU1JXR2_9PROT|nr:GntR family transcriptional regulator [Inquilinus ginsengisoli]MDR6293398.1 DNA-binding GntR family transcriptional regulator [Inquilinus ginsengisoli]
MNLDPAHSFESAAHRLERELRRAIMALELAPGARLSEQEIAQRYGVSRQPVREALIALARSRLVEIQPQRGTVVVKLSVRRMMEARFVRESVEVAVVRRACDGFDRASRERIDDLLDAQDRVAARGSHHDFQRYDELFHIALAEGAGCGMAWVAVADLKSHMDRICTLTLPGGDAMAPLVAQHRDIMAAVDARDADGAERAMRHHLTEILRALPRIEADHPELFDDPAVGRTR